MASPANPLFTGTSSRPDYTTHSVDYSTRTAVNSPQHFICVSNEHNNFNI